MRIAPLPRRPARGLRRPCAWLALTLALIGLGLAAASRAETTAASGATVISSLPCSINAPGLYCLVPPAGSSGFAPLNLANNAAAVTITASNVVLDFNGYTLVNGSGSAPANAAIGVCAGSGLNNITVRNGTLVGFGRGVYLYTPTWDYSGAYGDLVENMHISVTGYSGIELYGGGHTVRHCRIDNNSALGGTFGIGIQGPGSRVVDNDLTDLNPSGAYTYGIFFNTGSDNLAVGNRITRVSCGLMYAGSPASTGKYRDNLTGQSVTTPFSGGTDAGNN